MSASDPAVAMAELQSGAGKYDHESRRILMHGIRKRLDSPFRKLVSELKTLVEAGRVEAASLREKAEADEGAMAAAWGLVNAPGRLSRACDELDRRLDGKAEQVSTSLAQYEMATHRPAPPGCLRGVVEAFA